jgi:micrococcal nuclease
VVIRRVLSGQAIQVGAQQELRSLQSVRLIGISAPDLKQSPWGTASRHQLQNLLTHETVVLETDTDLQDGFGRQLAYVWQGNRLLNEELVAEGYALATPRSPNLKYAERLQRAQEKARILELGIWNPQTPLRQTPSEFRRSAAHES